jgi:hypothetical protein
MGSRRRAAVLLAVATMTFTVPQAAAAQQSVADALTFLLTNQSVNTGSVERDTAAAQATSTTISRALLANLATLPVTSTSGAFVYRLNPDIGTVERAAPTFGPVFIDRALTSGGASGGIGVTFQHLHFTSLDGRNLRDGSLVTTANQFVDESEPFDVDQLTLKLDVDVATLYGSVGLGGRVDVSAAAPIVWLRMNGTRVNTYRGRQFTQAAASARAIGLADLLLRGKVTLVDQDGGGLAAAVDVRLPTGREEDLLGSGKRSVRFGAIGSIEGARASAHANLGIALGGLGDEFNYGFAIAAAASTRATVSVEALGRWADLPGDIQSVTQRHPTLAGVNTIRLLPSSSRLLTLTVAPGIKWNVADTWVLVANVGVPMMKGGLRAPLLPFVGLEYSVGR